MDRLPLNPAYVLTTAIGTGLTRATPPRIRRLDLLDFTAVERVIEEVNPSVIVHWYVDFLYQAGRTLNN
jgi:dTDP-4-dehydrorhamnose reductase